jgi:hypothetical protein
MEVTLAPPRHGDFVRLTGPLGPRLQHVERLER